MKRRILVTLGLLLMSAVLLGTTLIILEAIHDPVSSPSNAAEATVSRMYAIRERLAEHYVKHQAIPTDLTSLLMGPPDLRQSQFGPLRIRYDAAKDLVELECRGPDKHIRGEFRLIPGRHGAADEVAPWIEDPKKAVRIW